jgi:hypothetical protein
MRRFTALSRYRRIAFEIREKLDLAEATLQNAGIGEANLKPHLGPLRGKKGFS